MMHQLQDDRMKDHTLATFCFVLFNVKVSHFLSNVRVSADTEAIILEYSLELIYSLPSICEWVNYISCWFAEEEEAGEEKWDREHIFIYIYILVYSKSCFDSPLLKHLHLKSNSLLKIQNQNHSNKTEAEKNCFVVVLICSFTLVTTVLHFNDSIFSSHVYIWLCVHAQHKSQIPRPTTDMEPFINLMMCR